MDPLSITTGVLSLLGVCYTVGTELKKLYDDIDSVNETVAAILDDVKALTKVLDTMRASFDNSPRPMTGHVGTHWENIYCSLKDGNEALGGLHEIIQEVSKETSILSEPRKHMRLKAAEGKIGQFRNQIKSFRDTLQLSMQALILWNQVSIQGSNDRILPSLEDMQREIRDLAGKLNDRISLLQTLPVDTSAQENRTKPGEKMAMTNLRNCIRSAATIVSSASTILSIDQDDEIETCYGSDWGDIFPTQTSEATIAWLQESLGNGEMQMPTWSRPPHTETSDSDSDLDLDLALGLFKKAQVKFRSCDYKGAEPLLRNCLSRLMPMTDQGRTRPQNSDLPSAHELLSLLCQTYIGLDKWEEAASAMVDKIALRPHGHDDNGEAALKDISTLVMILHAKKDYVQSHLYGRKLLRGYRKLGAGGEEGVERSLTLLVAICKASGNADEEQAYSVMLEDLREKKPAQVVDLDLPLLRQEGGQGGAPAVTATVRERQVSTEYLQRPDVGGSISVQGDYLKPSSPGAYWPRASVDPAASEGSVEPVQLPTSHDTSTIASLSVPNAVQSQDSLVTTVAQIPSPAENVRSEPSAEQLLLQSKYFRDGPPLVKKPPVKKKLAIVGDTLCGKSLLLHHQSHGNIDAVKDLSEAAGLLETFYTTVTLANQPVDIVMLDSPGQDDYDRLRPLIYQGTDVVLLVFNKGDPDCFDNITEKWIGEVYHFLPGVPIILVGNKKDLEHDPRTIAEARKIGHHPVMYEEGAAMAAGLSGVTRYVKYMECSARTGEGVREVFEFAALYALLGGDQAKPKGILRQLFKRKA